MFEKAEQFNFLRNYFFFYIYKGRKEERKLLYKPLKLHCSVKKNGEFKIFYIE